MKNLTIPLRLIRQLKSYFFLIFLFSTAYYTSQKITFVNEFGNALKSKKVIFHNQFRKDTFTTNRKGFIFINCNFILCSLFFEF